MRRNYVNALLFAICLTMAACSSTPAPTEVTTAATETLVPSATPFPTATQTTLPPMIQVNEQVNCYSGPGENGYQLVVTFERGEQMDVVGKDASNQYWIVMDSKSSKGCWVESQYTTGQGIKETLPVLIPAPTVTTRPASPQNIDVTYTCEKGGKPWNSYFYLSIYITWIDTSSNETGFEVYKNGNLWQTLETDVNQAQEGIESEHVIMGSATYAVLAFNDTGNSNRVEKTITYHCP